MILNVILLFSLFGIGSSLKMYNSTLSRNNTKEMSGLKLIDGQQQNIDWSNGITICSRFNLKKINGQFLFYFGDGPGGVRIYLGYPESMAYFGQYFEWPNDKNKKANWLTIDQWNHLCFAVDKKKSTFYVYMVGSFILSSYYPLSFLNRKKST